MFKIYENYLRADTSLYDPSAIILPFSIIIILSALSKYFTACVGIITVLFFKNFVIVSSIMNFPTCTSTALKMSSSK